MEFQKKFGEITSNRFQFTKPSELNLADYTAVSGAMKFIIAFSKHQKFLDIMKTPGEFEQMIDCIIKVLMCHTFNLTDTILQSGEPQESGFVLPSQMEVVTMQACQFAFRALAVMIRDYEALTKEKIFTNNAFFDFMEPFWFDYKNFYYYGHSHEPLEVLTSTASRAADLLELKPEYVRMLVTNFSRMNLKCQFYVSYPGILSRFASTARGKKELMEKTNGSPLILKVLGFLNPDLPIDLRLRTAEIIHYCCEEREFHADLLGPEIDVLPTILLPLAGPEEFSEEENDSLPIDLQYLEASKTREPDPRIRRLLLQSLVALARFRDGRVIVREKNTYLILRELHKVEKDSDNMTLIEGLVDVLIQHEEEITLTNALGDLMLD